MSLSVSPGDPSGNRAHGLERSHAAPPVAALGVLAHVLGVLLTVALPQASAAAADLSTSGGAAAARATGAQPAALAGAPPASISAQSESPTTLPRETDGAQPAPVAAAPALLGTRPAATYADDEDDASAPSAITLPPQFLTGPRSVPLAGEATLALPSGYAFLPALETRAVLREWGNRPSEATIGMVIPIVDMGAPPPWFIVLSYSGEGRVETDDSNRWNHQVMLEQLRARLQKANSLRDPDMLDHTQVLGWERSPTYDAVSHRLTWSLLLSTAEPNSPISKATAQVDRPTKATGETNGAVNPTRESGGVPGQSADELINVNTVILGRHGHLDANVVLPIEELRSHSNAIEILIGALSFDSGKGYSDFVVGDPVSPRALGELIVADAPRPVSWLNRVLDYRTEMGYVGLAVLLGGLMGAGSRWRASRQLRSNPRLRT